MARNDDDFDLKKAPTADQIRKRWEDGEKDVAEARRMWWVHNAFHQGEQWIRWDSYTRSIVPRARDLDGERRVTINRIRPAMNSLMGRLTARPLRFENKPTAADDATVAAARLGENVLNTTHDVQDWEKLRAAEIRDAYMGCTSIVYLDWDPSAGERLMVDESTENVVGTGEIKLCELAVTEFVLAPGVRDGYMSPYWISGVAMPTDEAMRRYKLTQRPEADALLGRSGLQRSLLSRGGKADTDCCLVLTYWQPPADDRKGYVATVIAQDVVDGPHPWPFPFKELNLALFTQDETKTWVGSTSLADVIGPQHAYNCMFSANIEAAKLAGTPYLAMDQMTAAENEDITDEPGSKLVFAAGSQPPFWLVPPGPTRGLRELVHELDAIIDDALANHAVSRGDVNVNRTPAASIAQLAEKDDTPLGRFSHNQAAGWARLARLILTTYEKKVTESRTVTMASKGHATVATQRWNGKMLRGQTNVSVPLEVTKPFSRVAARQSAIELNDRLPPGTLSPVRLLELFGIDPDDALEVIDPDVDKAKRENVRMLAGEELAPALFDVHPKHIAEHNTLRKSAAYEEAPPHVKWIVDMHCLAHETLEAEQMAQQMAREQAVKGAAALPQAMEPPGSAVPPPHDMQQAAAMPGPQNVGPPPGQ